ncbi:primosomal protein DnaI [Virgibacillus sp. 179-BFC.A HS]|uniref:Primosomal protein DnaI n=1 Tax=Tigheibacillus jepli TaxID=3035914 RepID=A0ABU5CGB8_9BACI|nr:primosomal protein DnaI [Virgibacillus sp. 179-BFC.A HS]MDY0405366.1 primosomal protein DnaI [Virgibacillus sp. 179-BFC.A HS]
MEPVQSTLKKWMANNKNFQEQYEEIKKEVINSAEIKAFLGSHPEITKKEIDKNLIKLYEYKSQSKQCDRCESFEKCTNMIQGYSPVLHVTDGEIHLSYEKCHLRRAHEKEQAQRKLVQSLYMPKDILQASITDIDNDEKRGKALAEMNHFIRQLKNGLPPKGIYFYGPFGVGKTYFLGAIANVLKQFEISSMLIYMPEFVREIRASIKDDSINKKIDAFKNIDVLMLDDIGAEMQSAWFRDEILGSILQYRMMEKLPVFFTSNYSLDQLSSELETTRDGVETVKAKRIIERIKQVSKEVPVFGKNRRN